LATLLFQKLFDDNIEFCKLEKIEFSGIKGKVLSAEMYKLFEEFNDLYKKFNEIPCDPLDPNDEVQ